ncbi:MAG: NADP-dependent isocitrate dehydrogenase [Ignavibacteriaceae bacterium]|jgi:isocitrate dehydrogenase|nr:NADP-dependent isocitrate dehydrogenase [Ignavibacteriaceae bacterium]
MSEYTPITIARGDGIGPEIMAATLKILEAAGAKLDIEEIEIGEKVYLSGIDTGLSANAFSSLQRTKVFLKAPITTPRGGGYKSLNVTTRKAFGLYANVRPCKSYRPFIRTKHPDMDVVIIRENEEDVYAGIEHRQTAQVYQCLKLFSRAGTEKIIRYAFEYAREYGRKKISLFVKDNIMKITDGLYHQVFKEIAPEYPEIESDTWIVDIGAARLADTPEKFDVIVMSNLYGDILSDVAAQISGSIGLAGSSNIGEHLSMFEAIHGSAPDIAGKNLANPSGLLLSAVMMLVHIGQIAPAEAIHNAWFRTIENGIHTSDIFEQGISSVRVGTAEFADAVISNLGKTPHELKPAHYFAPKPLDLIHASHEKPEVKKLVGVDIFIDWTGSPDDIGNKLDNTFNDSLKLKLITNRGMQVYPGGIKETFCTDHWRCRFRNGDWNEIEPKSIIDLMSKINEAGFEIIKTENLYTFNDELGFSEAHG